MELMLGLSNGSNEIIAEPGEDKKPVLQSNKVTVDWDWDSWKEQTDGLLERDCTTPFLFWRYRADSVAASRNN